jgi:defect in organelle trafficking protein DotC
MLRKIFLLVPVLLSLGGCCANSFNKGSIGSPKYTNKSAATTDLNQENLRALNSTTNKSKIGTIRMQALRDTALSVGARGGLAYRATEINNILARYEKTLSRVFNFQHMLLDNNVLPPVLLEARNTLNLTGEDIIRISDRQYQIYKQARFVTAPPTWRDYLWLNYSKPETPDKTMLPRTKAEKIVWEKYIDDGWKSGVLQAELIYKENVARIKRDYDGMIRYRKLLDQNMVSAPFVASLDLGITGDAENMNVNDRVLRITAFPSLQQDGNQWKTEIIAHE